MNPGTRVSVGDMSGEETGAGVDRPQRKAFLTTATLSREGAREASVRVRNLSRTGLGGVASQPFPRGEELTVNLKGIGPVHGRVAWSEGGRFGMAFDKEIDLESLELTPASEVKLAGAGEVLHRFEPITDYRRPGFRSR